MPWSKAKPMSTREQRTRLDDEVELYQFPKRKFVQVRYVGPYISYARGWVRIRNSKYPRDSDKKFIEFPRICSDYDPKSESFRRDRDPFRKAGVYFQQRFLSNFIVRDIQNDPPRRLRKPDVQERKRRRMLGQRWRIKDKDSRTWTPVRCHDMPPTVAEKLANMSELNRHRINGKMVPCDIEDPRYGMDVLIKYNPDSKSPAGVWDVQRANPTRLSREEMNYCIWNLEGLKSLQPDDRKTELSEWERTRKVFAPKKKRDDKKSDRGGANKSNRRRRSRDNFRGDRDRSERRRRNSSGGKSSERRRARSSRRPPWEDLDELDD